MSIKTIEENYVGMDKGVAKKINKGAEKLVFDILQATQYSTPIPSTVRELVTNACDAQREKEIAIEILTGTKQVSDYYITRDGEQYSDSNFDLSYYSISNLDIVRNHIEITYQHNDGIGYCDKLFIKDYGVGIGAKRLEGILELGYSTKRNTSQNFGAFGLGAKVALSTGVDFYTIETVYNGKRFKANCFNYKTDFIIPKFNLTTGQINPSITLSDGSVVYYEDTVDLNWTEVSFGVKSHNSSRFDEAIEEQLNYLDNVRFYVEMNGHKMEQKIKSEIIYNSKNLIVSTNNYLRKPHIVIVKEEGAETGINYGYVDFRELEMQDLYGPVGLKCPIKQFYIDEEGQEVIIQDGVEVTPSREKVIWSDSTKAFIQKLIDAAADEVTELVEKELLETDFLKWLDTCRQIIGGKTNNKNSDNPSERTLAILSNIIDTKSIKPKYSPNPSIKFTSIPSTLNGFTLKIHDKKTIKSFKSSGVTAEFQYTSDKIDHWEQIGDKKVFYRTGNANKYKDFYLHNKYGVFVTIKKTNLSYLQEQIDTPGMPDIDIAHYQAEYTKKKYNQDLIEPLIKASELYESYDDIVLPDNIKELFDGAEASASIKESGGSLTPEERRKLNSQIVGYTLRPDDHRTAGNSYKDFVWDKVEPTLRTVINSTIPTYYGTDDDADKLKMAAAILSRFNITVGKFITGGYGGYVPHGSNNDTAYYFDCLASRFRNTFSVKPNVDYSEQTQLLKLSESNVKHVRDLANYKHIDEFFRTVDAEGNYTCHPAVNMLANHMWAKQFPIWESFSVYNDCFNLDFIDEKYNEIYKYLLNIYTKFDSIVFYKTPGEDLLIDVKSDLTNLTDFELLSAADISDDMKAELSAKFFVLSDIPGVKVLDYKFMEVIRFADEFAKDTKHLLPRVSSYNISETNEQIKIYLKTLRVLEIPIPELN
jgi:ribosomal protein L23